MHNISRNLLAEKIGGEAESVFKTASAPNEFPPRLDENARENWQTTQDKLADDKGLSILLIDGHQPPALAVSNNNSVCRVLQSSPAHLHLCEPFCGQAFDKTRQANGAISYICHAGLMCVAVPLPPNPVRPLAAIVGRALTKISDYQNLLDRVENGDWQDLPADQLLKDLRFAESEAEIFDLADELGDLGEPQQRSITEFVARTELNPFSPPAETIPKTFTKYDEEPTTAADNRIKTIIELESENRNDISDAMNVTLTNTFDEKQIAGTTPIQSGETLEDFAAWQSFTDALLDKSLKDAAAETLRFLAARYDFTSLGWLERGQNFLKPFITETDLSDVFAKLDLAADDAKLREASFNETSLRLTTPARIEIFPLAVGEDIRAALIVGDAFADDERRRRVARFCHQIALSFEVLRLREELTRRAEMIRAVQLFSEKLNAAEEKQSSDANVTLFDTLMETCAELLHANRGSLLMYDDAEQKLKIQAAVGPRSEELKQTQTAVGERIAEKVWREGKPYIVENAAQINLPPAPPERGYQSISFISFPLFAGNRVIGVLNVTDKRGVTANDTTYDAGDLNLLEAVAPQLSIALDRASLQQKAGKFEQLSITDSLTGLLNRRYLNERLSEEVSRSNRDGSPMSFIMIDIDNFKKYNDRFGHQAGDEVLRLTALCLKAVLRGADVAARYGGEEFCLLLPNTTLSEARLIGERIRQRVETTQFAHTEVTVSIGVSAYSPLHNSPQEIIEAADKALYQAKRIGKNNVQLWLFGQTRR